VGIVSQTVEGGSRAADEVFGKPLAANQLKYAIGGAPEGARGFGVGFLLRAARLITGWKLRGQTWPHPYFDRATGKPNRPVAILSKAEREALRPLCGPTPSQTLHPPAPSAH
jgi:hypothetical protein